MLMLSSLILCKGCEYFSTGNTLLNRIKGPVLTEQAITVRDECTMWVSSIIGYGVIFYVKRVD